MFLCCVNQVVECREYFRNNYSIPKGYFNNTPLQQHIETGMQMMYVVLMHVSRGAGGDHLICYTATQLIQT